MKNTRGVGNLSPGELASLCGLLAQEMPTAKIMALTGCTKHVVSHWRLRLLRGTGDLRETGKPRPSRARIAQLCLVDQCHEAAVSGKYCEAHALTPGQRGQQSPLPMSRLMGGR